MIRWLIIQMSDGLMSYSGSCQIVRWSNRWSVVSMLTRWLVIWQLSPNVRSCNRCHPDPQLALIHTGVAAAVNLWYGQFWTYLPCAPSEAVSLNSGKRFSWASCLKVFEWAIRPFRRNGPHSLWRKWMWRMMWLWLKLISLGEKRLVEVELLEGVGWEFEEEGELWHCPEVSCISFFFFSPSSSTGRS